jgi:hypothetical protein
VHCTTIKSRIRVKLGTGENRLMTANNNSPEWPVFSGTDAFLLNIDAKSNNMANSCPGHLDHH